VALLLAAWQLNPNGRSTRHLRQGSDKGRRLSDTVPRSAASCTHARTRRRRLSLTRAVLCWPPNNNAAPGGRGRRARRNGSMDDDECVPTLRPPARPPLPSQQRNEKDHMTPRHHRRATSVLLPFSPGPGGLACFLSGPSGLLATHQRIAYWVGPIPNLIDEWRNLSDNKLLDRYQISRNWYAG